MRIVWTYKYKINQENTNLIECLNAQWLIEGKYQSNYYDGKWVLPDAVSNWIVGFRIICSDNEPYTYWFQDLVYFSPDCKLNGLAEGHQLAKQIAEKKENELKKVALNDPKSKELIEGFENGNKMMLLKQFKHKHPILYTEYKELLK